MEKFYYTQDRSTQILISLLKAHGIKKIVISPGTTNICLVGSIQNDSYFEIYSAPDERSAAYIACGMAEESKEAVALSCTGATASRNYIPALTEAFYRKLPVLAITSMVHQGRIGNLFPQTLDRSNPLKDIAKLSIQVSPSYSEEDAWSNNVNINKALLELTRDGGGPIHVNLTTTFNHNFNVKELPPARVIRRISPDMEFPGIPNGRTAIFVGAHSVFSKELTTAVDKFCSRYNAVVLCDQTSNYRGKYRVLMNLVCDQTDYSPKCKDIELVIHIGNVSGAYASILPKQVWRVHPDGEVRDYFRTLQYVFEMDETFFFQKYANNHSALEYTASYWEEWECERKKLLDKIPELPFSNIWMAKQLAYLLPENSVLHLGILNSLRAWNFFETKPSVYGYANTGGFGIDGCISTLLGASLASPDKLFFCIVGDLGFFYDMNVCGNRHLSNNIRILLVNNGKGTEFRNYSHPADKFGDDADKFMAAGGHYGQKSDKLIKHYAVDLGFEYLSASSKEDFLEIYKEFIKPKKTEKPILFEVFTNSTEESEALNIINHLEVSQMVIAKKKAADILGEKGVRTVKKILKK